MSEKTQLLDSISIAILIPCYNEEKTIGEVIYQFKKILPQALIYVYDNNSTDDSLKISQKAGATVSTVRKQGKGNVIRRMFLDIDADIYLMVDADLTYDTTAAPKLIAKLIKEKLDMVVGSRQDKGLDTKAYRYGHRFGNKLFTRVVSTFFKSGLTDILSGYRVFSRRFVKSFPAMSDGFDIETELTIHSLENNLPVGEVETVYSSRPEGSVSKLNKYRDGIKIMFRIIKMLKISRPFFLFGTLGAALSLTSVLLGFPILITYLKEGLVPRIPTAILCSGIMIIAFTIVICGIILESICQARRERNYLHYLSLPWLRKDRIS